VGLPESELVCSCDPVRIEQIVWHLLGNAIKFTPQGGAVRVSLSKQADDARFEVIDTGAGISAEFLPNVFELFNQGDLVNITGQRRPGLGICLALVKELVQAHDGRISARSEGRGQGSTFTIWLPLQTSSPVASKDGGAAASLNCRVLMVDDDEEALMALSALIEMDGASRARTHTGSLPMVNLTF
jgi:two-component system CheB/CheR fusion protein